MKSELHLFILWEKSKAHWDRILNDIRKKFKIVKVFKNYWSQEHFATNLTRFYGRNLPPESNKEKHCGAGPFMLVIIKDKNPKYDERKTSKGTKKVNVNIFDAKMLYRKWTGGGHKIHATNSTTETNHDLALLLDTDSKSFFSKYNKEWDGVIADIHMDLVGTKGWKSMKQLLTILNATIDYVILRNYECLPEQYIMKSHGDIDILTDSYQDICFIANAKKVFKQPYRVQNRVKIAGEEIQFDFRYVGDGYYDQSWEESILKNKILTEQGFYVPNDYDYFYSLLYHAIVHKSKFASDYRKKLINLSKKLNINSISEELFNSTNDLKLFLDKYLNQMNYKYSTPIDLSVFINRKLVGEI
ncbi:hypothetical protein [Wukongibacter sp. M2B1]|uniref:hypothetical protein n=1 Tax=Wukongibacter sp. M2B1 TaxID=3088895 RepID=UPI003D7A773E